MMVKQNFCLRLSNLFLCAIFSLVFFADQLRAEVYRTLLLTVPFAGREISTRAEYNLSGEATISAEGTMIQESEEYSKRYQEENDNTSLVTKGYEGSIYFARYSKSQSMSGFYWALGLGYRRLDATWKRQPKSEYGLVDTKYKDDEGRVTNDMTISGNTGHARLGYRYAPDSYPFAIGGFVGLRHFENKFQTNNEAEDAPFTDQDKMHLQYFMMTKSEIGMDFGVVF